MTLYLLLSLRKASAYSLPADLLLRLNKAQEQDENARECGAFAAYYITRNARIDNLPGYNWIYSWKNLDDPVIQILAMHGV